MIYLLVLVLVLVPCIKYDFLAKEGGEGIWYQICLWALILLAAFRYRTGGDTLIYHDIFEYYPTISELSDFDFSTAEYNPMWYVYNSIFKSLGDSFFLFQLCQAIFVNIVIFRFLYRYCSHFFLALVVYYLGYYFYFNMEIQREILCICIFLLSYPLLEQKRYLPYYLLSILAISFHVSALVLLFVPLLTVLKKDRFYLCLILCVCMSLILYKFNLVDLVLSSFFGKNFSIVRQYFSFDTPNIIGATITLLIGMPFLILFYVRKRCEIENDSLMGALLNAVVLIYCMGAFIPGPTRLANYFMLFGVVFVINTVVDNIDKIRSSQITTLLVVGALFIYSFNLSYFYLKNKEDDLAGTHVYDRYLPYVSVFNPHNVDKRERLLMNERYEKEYSFQR